MGAIAVGLVIIGGSVQFVGAIWFLYVVFNESILWGLVCSLVPFAGLVFLATHWYDASKPCGVTVLGGLILIFASFIMSGRGSGRCMVTSRPSGRAAP